MRDLIKKYPKIISGRKNVDQYHLKIVETVKLIKKYIKKINN